MTLRAICLGIVMALGVAMPVWAKPGHGQGRGQDVPSVKETGKRVANEVADAVADELLDEHGRVTTASRPPGLAKQDKMPPGLAKQGKTPPGWSKGKKAGWHEGEPKKESVLHRLTRGIFRKATQPAPPSKDKTP